MIFFFVLVLPQVLQYDKKFIKDLKFFSVFEVALTCKNECQGQCVFRYLMLNLFISYIVKIPLHLFILEGCKVG